MFVRTVTAIFLAIIIIPFLIFSHTNIFVAAVCLFSVAATAEFLRCLGFSRNIALALPSYLFALVAPLLVRIVGEHGQYVLYMAAVLFVYMLYMFSIVVFSRREYDLRDISEVYMGCIYISVGFSSIILLRDFTNGQYLYLLIFIGAWITDIFAYFTGVLFGRHKLIPKISPKKTVEGMIGGIVFCSAAFVLFGYIVGRISDLSPRYLSLAVAGIAVSLVSQFGDLIASVIKRQHNAKDFGSVFPGHGGVMDRFDSVIAIAPFLTVASFAPSVFSLFN